MMFALLAAAALAISAVNAFTVNTPANVVQCQPIALTWDPTGSTGPYSLSLHPGSDPTAPAVESFNNLSTSPYTWLVNLPAGSSYSLLLRDSTGISVQSAPFTIQTSTISSCLAASGSLTSSTTNGPIVSTTTTLPGSTTTPNTLPSASSVHSSSIPASGSLSASATGAVKSSAAGNNVAHMAVAGVVAAAVVAVLA